MHAAVAAAVANAREVVAEQGLEFMGSEAVKKKSFLQRARTYEAKWQINPVLAARDIIVRKVFIRVEKAFQAAYRAALQAWRGGDRWVTFPFGSWWMGVHHRAKVEPASG